MATSLGQYKNIDITPGSQEQIQAQMASIDSGSSVNSAALAPVQPLNIPTAPAATEASSFGSYLENLTTNTQQAKGQKDDSFSALMNSLVNTPGETALTSEAYDKSGVDSLDRELKDLNAQLMGEQEGLRRTVEDLQNNAEGLTRSGVAGKIDEARRKSLRTQADLAVVQMAKQGQFDSAKTIADRAVAAIMEKQKQRNELLKFVYEENKEQFTKAEQREFDTNQNERDRKLENEEYRLRAEFNQKIREQDPMYIAQLQNQRAQTAAMQQQVGTSYNMQMTQEDFDKLPTIDKNNTSLLQIFANQKVSPANRTAISAGLSLARAAQGLAGENPSGNFAGLYPFRGLVERFYPGTSPFKRTATVNNDAQINALNLKTQFWASGAALTEAQTEYVLGMVPTRNDTDAQVKTKLNTLVNFMMDQTSSQLLTDGISFQPEKVNLFETSELLGEASEEQKRELQAQGAL